jgi:hypothetical protein
VVEVLIRIDVELFGAQRDEVGDDDEACQLRVTGLASAEKCIYSSYPPAPTTARLPPSGELLRQTVRRSQPWFTTNKLCMPQRFDRIHAQLLRTRK